MIFSHYLFDKSFDFDDTSLFQLVFENPEDMSNMLAELTSQINGSDGRFIISSENKELDFSKNVVHIMDPFSMDINSKRISGGLVIKVMKEFNNGENYKETVEWLGGIENHIMSIVGCVEPEASTSDIDLQSLLRISNIKINQSSDMIENICNYTKMIHYYGGANMVIFTNLSSYLSEENYLVMAHELRYLNIPVLLIESKPVGNIPYILFDKDFCEICGLRKVFEV